jgi:hypothetical protein
MRSPLVLRVTQRVGDLFVEGCWWYDHRPVWEPFMAFYTAYINP